MIIKSFKLFESDYKNYEVYVVEVNSFGDMRNVMSILKDIDNTLYNERLFNIDIEFPNWLFVYNYSSGFDQTLIYSYSSNREGLEKRMIDDGNVYPKIFTLQNIYELYKILDPKGGVVNVRKMYNPKKIER